MVIRIDVHSGVPVYRQLVEQVRLLIAAGQLGPGDELPSTRALSADLGLNPMTVSRAWALLEEEDLVERRPGLPVVVRSLQPARSAAARREELRKALEPAAHTARQLGFSGQEAADALQKLIDGER